MRNTSGEILGESPRSSCPGPRAGVPSIVIGPGSIDQAHAAIEFVDCAEVEQAFEFYRMFMLSFV